MQDGGERDGNLYHYARYEVLAVDSKQAANQMIEAVVMYREKEYHAKYNTK